MANMKSLLRLLVSSRISTRSFSLPSSAFTAYAHYRSCDTADVHLFPMFNDNYGFILTDKKTGDSACIDAGDGEVILSAVNSHKFNLKALFCTHKHHDHIGGNQLIHKKLPNIEVIGGKYETIPFATKLVGDGDTFKFGSLHVDVLHVPCHTKGHIAYYITRPLESAENSKGEGNTNTKHASSPPLLFCGDTLFVGGCGRFFEGTAVDMLKNMDRFVKLPPETLVYCAHEYTESNLRFLAHIDPENCNHRYKEVKELRTQQGAATIPTTIGKELEYNLFMKCHEKRTQELVGATTAEEAMDKLRTMKNEFV